MNRHNNYLQNNNKLKLTENNDQMKGEYSRQYKPMNHYYAQFFEMQCLDTAAKQPPVIFDATRS